MNIKLNKGIFNNMLLKISRFLLKYFRNVLCKAEVINVCYLIKFYQKCDSSHGIPSMVRMPAAAFLWVSRAAKRIWWMPRTFRRFTTRRLDFGIRVSVSSDKIREILVTRVNESGWWTQDFHDNFDQQWSNYIFGRRWDSRQSEIWRRMNK